MCISFTQTHNNCLSLSLSLCLWLSLFLSLPLSLSFCLSVSISLCLSRSISSSFQPFLPIFPLLPFLSSHTNFAQIFSLLIILKHIFTLLSGVNFINWLGPYAECRPMVSIAKLLRHLKLHKSWVYCPNCPRRVQIGVWNWPQIWIMCTSTKTGLSHIPAIDIIKQSSKLFTLYNAHFGLSKQEQIFQSSIMSLTAKPDLLGLILLIYLQVICYP